MGILEQSPNDWVRRYKERHNGITSYMMSDAREAMLVAHPDAPILGCDMSGRPVAVNLDTESPHVIISMGTGHGKSVAVKALLAQLLRNGAYGVILDYKRHSHRWARHVPGVTYARDIAEIHDTLVALALEGRERNLRSDKLTDEEYERGDHIGKRVVIAVEEMNAMMAELQDYWTEIRPTGERHWKAPKQSPAIKALHQIAAMGRAVNLNLIAVAQRASTASMGGGGGYGAAGDARENFAVRILGRYTRLAWKMLVPECDYVPASKHLGRVQVAVAGVATETQVVYLTDSEAIEWATLVRLARKDGE